MKIHWITPEFKYHCAHAAVVFFTCVIFGIILGIFSEPAFQMVMAHSTSTASYTIDAIAASRGPLARAIAFFINNTAITFIMFILPIIIVKVNYMAGKLTDEKLMIIPTIITSIILGLLGVTCGIMGERAAEMSNILVPFAALVPHGIFEVPAIIIGIALGRTLALRTDYVTAEPLPIWEMIALFTMIVIPILVLAAFTESYITPIAIQVASGL